MPSEPLFPGTRDMTYPEYRFEVEDLRTGGIVAEYPLKGVSYNLMNKAITKMKGKFALTPEVQKQEPRRTLETGVHGIHVLRNDDPVWSGILIDTAFDEPSNIVSINAYSFEHWYERRIMNRDVNVKNVDQLDIARTYVTVDGASSVMRIEVDDTTTSTRKRERNSYQYEQNTIWDELSRLSNLEDGFDFRIVPYRDPETSQIKRKLTFGYPNLSNNSADNTPYLFESNRNILDSSFSFSSEDSAVRVIAVGEGEGTSQKLSVVDDLQQLALGMPRYEMSGSFKGVKVQSTLTSHAESLLKANRNPLTELSIKVRGNNDPYVGSYAPGDWARIKIDNNWFPEGYDNTFAMTEIAVTLEDSGLETVQMDFAGPYLRDAMVIKKSLQNVYVPPQDESELETP